MKSGGLGELVKCFYWLEDEGGVAELAFVDFFEGDESSLFEVFEFSLEAGVADVVFFFVHVKELFCGFAEVEAGKVEDALFVLVEGVCFFDAEVAELVECVLRMLDGDSPGCFGFCCFSCFFEEVESCSDVSCGECGVCYGF